MLDNQTNKGQHQYAYTYDYVGNRLDMTVTNAGGVGIHLYSYDDIYQITEVNYPAALSYLATDTQFNYDDAGNRSSVIDGSGTCNYTSNNLNQYTAAGPTNFQYDTSGNMTHNANYGYYYDPENRLIQVTKSGGPTDLAAALDSFLTYTTGGAANWSPVGGAYAQSGYINHGQESWMQAQVEGPGTLTFQWKVSSEAGCDQLQFYLDGDLQDAIDGEQDWDEMSYQVTGSGTHTFRWRYQKDYSLSEGEDAGYVDQVQWTGPLPEDPPADRWHHLTYVYDAAGRRIEKQYDYDTVLKYVYDGDHCLAEYDAGGNLRRKYIYGPAVDEPISMIESTGSYGGTYYYHFDALGSVVALTDSDANTVDVYEYDVYGRVGMLDANHPNRFLFTGREYDKETGLYYYRARYYNPQIGRFLQTDPIGYEDGMNWYRYCGNDPVGSGDPWGCEAERRLPPGHYEERNYATGNVLIVPYRLDPSMIQNSEWFKIYAKVLKELLKNTRTYPVNKWLGTYLDALEKSTDMTIAIAAADKSAWRVFIEVETVIITADKNGKRHEEHTNQRWVEVNHLDGWNEEVEDYRRGGYGTWESAVEAAKKGVYFYNIWANKVTEDGKRPDPPNEWFHDGIKHQMFGPKEHLYYGPSSKVWDLFDKKTGRPIKPPSKW